MNKTMSSQLVNSFPSAEQFESLYHELLERYYVDADHKGAKVIAVRLEKLLEAYPDYSFSIRGEEVRSLIAELRDDLSVAIQSREAEVRKILELHARTLNTPNWKYVSQQYDFNDVSDRLDLLAILYDKQGNLNRAIAVLLESKEYCQTHKITFDSQDLLDELEEARETAPDQTLAFPIPREILDRVIRKVYKGFGKTADEIVVIEETSRRFTTAVNYQLPKGYRISSQDLKKRLLTLRRRSENRGGLPQLKRRID